VTLLAAAFARVGYGTTPPRPLPAGDRVKITHPVKGYTGPVRGAARLDFVNGEATDTNLSAAQRKALEAAGFKVESTRAAKAAEGD
jgi:hypothetical protein